MIYVVRRIDEGNMPAAPKQHLQMRLIGHRESNIIRRHSRVRWWANMIGLVDIFLYIRALMMKWFYSLYSPHVFVNIRFCVDWTCAVEYLTSVNLCVWICLVPPSCDFCERPHESIRRYLSECSAQRRRRWRRGCLLSLMFLSSFICVCGLDLCFFLFLIFMSSMAHWPHAALTIWSFYHLFDNLYTAESN